MVSAVSQLLEDRCLWHISWFYQLLLEICCVTLCFFLTIWYCALKFFKYSKEQGSFNDRKKGKWMEGWEDGQMKMRFMICNLYTNTWIHAQNSPLCGLMAVIVIVKFFLILSLYMCFVSEVKLKNGIMSRRGAWTYSAAILCHPVQTVSCILLDIYHSFDSLFLFICSCSHHVSLTWILNNICCVYSICICTVDWFFLVSNMKNVTFNSILKIICSAYRNLEEIKVFFVYTFKIRSCCVTIIWIVNFIVLRDADD